MLVEVEQTDEGLVGSRYAGVVLEVKRAGGKASGGFAEAAAAGKRARASGGDGGGAPKFVHVEFDALHADAAGKVRVHDGRSDTPPEAARRLACAAAHVVFMLRGHS